MEEEKLEKLDPKVMKAWEEARGILLLCVIVSLMSVLFLMNVLNVEEVAKTIIFASMGVIILLCVLNIFLFTKIQYSRWGYYIGEDKVVIKKGMIFINIDLIPILRIQHISKEQGPIYKKFDLYSVSISTASGSFEIKGLTYKKSEEISENLKNKLVDRMKKEIN